MTRENSLYPDAHGDATQSPLLLAGLQVLVVDDDDDSRYYVSVVLEGDGASVTAVASAAEALEVLFQSQFHVLVCDIGMPGEDGYTFIRKVRVLEADKGGCIPAVALTAYAASEDRERALAAGFQSHVAKPVDPRELVAVVKDLVSAHLD